MIFEQALEMTRVPAPRRRRARLRAAARERAELLLELLANALLREKTGRRTSRRRRALQRLFAHEEGPLVGVVDLSLLKMKQRDEVEAVFGTWLEEVPFDVVRLRDERLRRLYQERYDARRNVLDWDYNMELVPTGATIVHKIHFREWRMTGIAYELRDSSYSCPNRSLASMAAGRENSVGDEARLLGRRRQLAVGGVGRRVRRGSADEEAVGPAHQVVATSRTTM